MHKPLFYFFALVYVLIASFNLKAQDSKRITLESCEALGRRMEQALTEGNTTLFVALFDKNEFINRIDGNLPASELAFFHGFTAEFNLQKVADQSIKNFGKGNYRFLRSYEKNGEKRLLFRLFGDAGINYHDYLVSSKRDSLKLTDVFMFTLGESMSDYYRNSSKIVRAAMGEDGSAEVVDLQAYNKYLKEKNYSAIAKLLETSKATILQYRSIQQYHIMASKHLGDSLYMASLERFAKLFPDAPNAFLYQIDAYYLAKQYEKGLEAVDKLDSAVAGDPYLDFFRGNLYYEWGKSEEALAAYGRLYKNDPLMNTNTRILIHRWMEAGSPESARLIVENYSKLPAHDPELLAGVFADYPELRN